MTKDLPAHGLVSIDNFATWAGIDPADVSEEINVGNLSSVDIDGITYVRVENPIVWRDAWLKSRTSADDGVIYSLQLVW